MGNRRPNREKRHKTEKRQIKWALSLHGKYVKFQTGDEPIVGIAQAVPHGNGALIKIGTSDVRWGRRSEVTEASEGDLVMARLMSTDILEPQELYRSERQYVHFHKSNHPVIKALRKRDRDQGTEKEEHEQ